MAKVNFYCGIVNSQGGSKISLLNLIFLYKKEKKDFEVFVNKHGWFTDKLEKNNIDFTIINEPKMIGSFNEQTSKFKKIFIVLLNIPKLIKNWCLVLRKISNEEIIIINENRDIILFLPFLFKKNVRVIQWIRSEYANNIAKLLLKKVDKVITVSDIVKDNIKGLTTKPIERIYNFMNSNPKDINYRNVNVKIINVAVIGSIQQIKGQLDAVKVVKSLKKRKLIILHIIGRNVDNRYTKLIKDYIVSNNLQEQIKIIGQVEDVPNYLNENIHFTLIPSQTESFCRVAMESMSVGVPVVAYSVGGLKEVVVKDRKSVV